MSDAAGTAESASRAEQRPSDEELLLRFRERGDGQAFAELVHRYERELYAYLRRYLGDAQLAEDVFQATFLRVSRKSHLYRAGRRVRPWLYSIATHLAVDALRRRGRQRAVSLDEKQTSAATESGRRGTLLDLLESRSPGPLAELEDREAAARARRAVDDLPDALRSTVILVFFQGLKYSEAAEALDVPVGTVKSRIHSALLKIDAALRAEAPPED